MHLGIDAHSSEREGEGNCTYIRNLIRALRSLEERDCFTLFAEDPNHPFYRSLGSSERFRVFPLRQRGGVVRLVWALSQAAARAEVDGLHVQYFAPFFYRSPLVVTVHDLGFLHVPDSFAPNLRLAMRVLVPWSIWRASCVITDSQFARHDMIARYRVAPEKIAVIRLGVGQGFHPRSGVEAREVLGRYGLEPGFVFSLGRLNRRKNLGRLLLAYGALRAEGVTNAPLVIGGKLDYGIEDLRGANSSKHAEGVRWMGLIPEDDLPAFYAGAACFVYPSLFEGFGIPLLEAMACGCPVISSDRGALPELVEDAGLVVDPESVDAIKVAMTRVLTDAGLREELKERGQARSRHFTWSETARRTLEVYRRTVTGH